jgi:hypothetical protein
MPELHRMYCNTSTYHQLALVRLTPSPLTVLMMRLVVLAGSFNMATFFGHVFAPIADHMHWFCTLKRIPLHPQASLYSLLPKFPSRFFTSLRRLKIS